MEATVELGGLGFPEALRWRNNELWFSDMFRGRVVRWHPGRPPVTVLDRVGGGPEMPGGLGWLPDGDLLVVDCLGRRLLRVGSGAGGRVSVHAELAGWLPHPANDLHVDPDGTAWVGGYGFDPERDAPSPSSLVRVFPDGEVTATAAPLTFPNGCERLAGGELVVAETFADRVAVVAPDATRVLRTIELEAGSGPDGLSIAPDGEVLVALAFAGRVVRLPSGAAVYSSPPLEGDSDAGTTGCYDCAVHPDGNRVAIATASSDEELAMRVDTGRVLILPLG